MYIIMDCFKDNVWFFDTIFFSEEVLIRLSHIYCSSANSRIDGVIINVISPGVWYFVGLSPGRVKPKTRQLVSAASPLSSLL